MFSGYRKTNMLKTNLKCHLESAPAVGLSEFMHWDTTKASLEVYYCLVSSFLLSNPVPCSVFLFPSAELWKVQTWESLLPSSSLSASLILNPHARQSTLFRMQMCPVMSSSVITQCSLHREPSSWSASQTLHGLALPDTQPPFQATLSITLCTLTRLASFSSNKPSHSPI